MSVGKRAVSRPSALATYSGAGGRTRHGNRADDRLAIHRHGRRDSLLRRVTLLLADGVLRRQRLEPVLLQMRRHWDHPGRTFKRIILTRLILRYYESILT